MKHRLEAVRAELARQELDGFLVPRADEHLAEYVPPGAERLAWLTGFTGSAGLAIVLRDRAAVFTDGRYTLQLAEQTDPALWERHHVTAEPPHAWLAAAAPRARIGYDPWLMAEEALRPLRRRDAGAGGAQPRRCRLDGPAARRPPRRPCRIRSPSPAGARRRSGRRWPRSCMRQGRTRR